MSALVQEVTDGVIEHKIGARLWPKDREKGAVSIYPSGDAATTIKPEETVTVLNTNWTHNGSPGYVWFIPSKYPNTVFKADDFEPPPV